MKTDWPTDPLKYLKISKCDTTVTRVYGGKLKEFLADKICMQHLGGGRNKEYITPPFYSLNLSFTALSKLLYSIAAMKLTATNISIREPVQ